MPGFRCIPVIAIIAVELMAGTCLAQYCTIEHTTDIENWSSLPPATPATPRAQAVQLLNWDENPYLMLNIGNGLKLYSLTDKLDPTYLNHKVFVCLTCEATPPGDYDWVLFNASICDDCRWGVAHFWVAGLALFSLGDDTQPHFTTDHHYYQAANDTYGAFMFSHGGSQYLIVNKLVSLNPKGRCQARDKCDNSHLQRTALVASVYTKVTTLITGLAPIFLRRC